MPINLSDHKADQAEQERCHTFQIFCSQPWRRLQSGDFNYSAVTTAMALNVAAVAFTMFPAVTSDTQPHRHAVIYTSVIKVTDKDFIEQQL